MDAACVNLIYTYLVYKPLLAVRRPHAIIKFGQFLLHGKIRQQYKFRVTFILKKRVVFAYLKQETEELRRGARGL